MDNLKITEGMVLALLGKGIVYELENCEMEYDIPLEIFGCGDEDHPSTMHMTMKIEKCKFEIHKG